MKHEVHKYKRLILGKNKDYYVYRCMIPGCTHYIHLPAALGRESVCWGASPDCLGRTFITELNVEVKTVHPICDKCKEYNRERREMMQTIPMIEGEIEDESL